MGRYGCHSSPHRLPNSLTSLYFSAVVGHVDWCDRGDGGKKKRTNHNELERKRRQSQKDTMVDLKEVLPLSDGDKTSTIAILLKGSFSFYSFFFFFPPFFKLPIISTSSSSSSSSSSSATSATSAAPCPPCGPCVCGIFLLCLLPLLDGFLPSLELIQYGRNQFPIPAWDLWSPLIH